MKTIKFIPESLQDEKLFDKFTTLLDIVLEKEKEVINPILHKLDPQESKEDIEDIYKEFGFDYLVDMLSVEETSKILATYFSLIRMYKGKRSGLELLFQLLGWEYEIVEWWEDPTGALEPFTAKCLIHPPAVDLGEAVSKLYNFLRNYVYPLCVVAIYRRIDSAVYIGSILNQGKFLRVGIRPPISGMENSIVYVGGLLRYGKKTMVNIHVSVSPDVEPSLIYFGGIMYKAKITVIGVQTI